MRSDDGQAFEPVCYRGRNTVREFIFKIKEVEKMLMEKIKHNEPMVMTAQDKEDFKCASNCCLCAKPLGKDRVHDHDHLTGAYRGAAHSKCNIEEGKKRTRHYEIPVFFHNLKGYDSHLIISEIGKHTSKLTAIPQNFEKMISFSFSHLKFLDSMGFLTASLDTLVNNLYEGGKGKGKFMQSAQHCVKKQHLDLLLGPLEHLVTGLEQPDSLLKLTQRFLQPQFAGLEGFHDLLELLHRFLEGRGRLLICF